VISASWSWETALSNPWTSRGTLTDRKAAFLCAVLRVVTRCQFCVLYVFCFCSVFLVFLCVYTYKKIIKIVITFIFHTHMRRHGVRCVSYSFYKIHNDAVILLVCKNLCSNLSLLLSNLLGGLVCRWQKSNMAAIRYSEWSFSLVLSIKV